MRLLYAYYISIELAVDKHMRNMAMQRQPVAMSHLHVESVFYENL